jgi:hypothetical protein
LLRVKKQGPLAKRESDVFAQSRASSLVKGFENSAPAWLAKALSCAAPIRVNQCHPWFKTSLSKLLAPRSLLPIFVSIGVVRGSHHFAAHDFVIHDFVYLFPIYPPQRPGTGYAINGQWIW